MSSRWHASNSKGKVLPRLKITIEYIDFKCTIRTTNHWSWKSILLFLEFASCLTLKLRMCLLFAYCASPALLSNMSGRGHWMLWIENLNEAHSFHLCNFTCFCHFMICSYLASIKDNFYGSYQGISWLVFLFVSCLTGLWELFSVGFL